MTEHASQSNHIRFVGAFAGIGSGLTKVAVGHGFDTVKTRMQCSAPGTYHGAFDVFRQTIRNEGILAIYKGATPPAVMWAAIDSLLLGSLHNYRLFLFRNGLTELNPATQLPRLTITAHGLAGLLAGWTSTVLATPMELLKVKLQLQMQRDPSDRQFRGTIDCARKIVRTQGIFGLYSGFTGSVVCRTNFCWLFLSFEAFMRGFAKLQGTPYEITTGFANFLAGGFSSFAFWIMAIPADNVKNRMMAYPYPKPYPMALSNDVLMERPSFLLVTKKILATEGYRGFFRGLGPCLLRSFPVNASALFVYESLLRAFGAEKTRQ
ncbi:mitochondrial carrier [Guyanagaster necrorhizus]|uniref:Mitochondrial carrier n=1 Tax=Guyanagaster necrorhizus TaxID=856835 RepID=A0A9P7W258_9AGAR|nr:mitochondrial carrier [Guyanagaster necrorhizus MCA 3950]KAG7450599.1 mitochondrial carrier [Guyanagaster necrorhizus MCA 3950]